MKVVLGSLIVFATLGAMPRTATAGDQGLPAGDRAGIRAAWEAARYAACRVEDGYLAHNSGQGWQTHFDGRGFTTVPDAGGWTWGLEFLRCGLADREREVTGSPHIDAAGGRVTYDWNATIEERFENGARGLEHGYTIQRRPRESGAAGAGELVLTLGVRGSLRPEVTNDGRGVHFQDATGAAILTYTGLCAFDAEGRRLAARFEGAGEQLRLLVDARSARYPLTIDPVAQNTYIKASNTDPADQFGYSLAVSGDTAVVGAWRESSGATGVNGDQSDNSASGSGAAYVFVRSGAGWVQEAYLKASNPDMGDAFGWPVDISGDTVVVGARGECSNATGVNGNQADNSINAPGAAYVFARSGTTWSQQAYLKASNTEAQDFFGSAVAVSGDTVVVSAPSEDSGSTGVNGDQSNNNIPYSGAVYVFVRSGTIWSQQAYIKASNPGNGDEFGYSLAADDDTVVVGAYHEDSNATTINGNQSDDSALQAGAAYVFVRSGTNWSQQAYLKTSNMDSYDLLGCSVAISGDRALLGARGERSNSTRVNNGQSDNSASNAGAAYVFERNGTTWSEEAYLKALNTGWGDVFGISVGISGDTVVVGASGEDCDATGVDGWPHNDNDNSSGAAYLFQKLGPSWSQWSYLKASNTASGEYFGYATAISGDTVLIGAYGEDSNATGMNGDQSDNSASMSGAVYHFAVLDPPTSYCSGKTTSESCVPYLDYTGNASAAGTGPFKVITRDTISGSVGLWIYSRKKGAMPDHHGGKLCVKSPFMRTAAKTAKSISYGLCPSATGRHVFDFQNLIQGGLDPSLTVGRSVFIQARFRDPTDPQGFGDGLSNGMKFLIAP